MKVMLTASTAASIVVWTENNLYYARLADAPEQPQVCLAVDLFEVIAEIAGLNLEDKRQAAEATALAERAQMKLSQPGSASDDNRDPEPDADEDGDSATRSSVP